MVLKYSFDFEFLNFLFLGKITWQEYAALYVKFHKMNTTSIKDLDNVNFIEESFDEKCKDIRFSFFFLSEMIKEFFYVISATRTSENSKSLDRS